MILRGLGCQICVLGGLGCQISGFGGQHRELNPRPPDPKPCGQPFGYMGFVWVVWGATYGVWGDLGAEYRVWGGLGCQIRGFGWFGVPNTEFGVVWDITK